MIHAKLEINAGGQIVSLYTYLLDSTPELNQGRKRPAVLICPGGGYEMTSDREAEPIAVCMNAAGFHAAVLHYSVKPAVFPAALNQAAQATALLREHSDEWRIDPSRVFVMGFSAGGHLAASLGTLWNKGLIETKGRPVETYRPNGLLLAYPVISSGRFAHQGSFDALLAGRRELLETVSLEKQVDRQTPPAFIWHTYEDELVPVENSLLFAQAMRKQGVPFALHIYQYGGHGLSLSTGETDIPDWPAVSGVSNWIDLAIDWIKAF
jgi:acetyl esterase/lipase